MKKTLNFWSYFYLLLNFLILSYLIYSKTAFSSENEEIAKAIGEGKAILKVSEAEGFQLSKGAVKSLNIKFQNYFNNEVELNKDALVASGDFKGVFRYRDNYFKLIEVILISESEKFYKIRLSQFQAGDKIVTSGVNLLRVADIYSTNKSEYKD